MANQTSTLHSQPTEVKKHPSKVLGAIPDGFETIWDSIVGGPSAPVSEPRIVNEGLVSAKDFEQVRQWPERVTGVSTEGSLTGFQKARRAEDAYPEISIQQSRQTAQELIEAWRKRLAKAPLEQKRGEVNGLNGFDPSYLGTVDEQGNVNSYHQAEADKKQSENLALRIQGERSEQLAQTSGKAVNTKATVGPTINLNTTFEDRNADKPG